MKQAERKQQQRKRDRTFKGIVRENDTWVIDINPCKLIDGEIYWNDINWIDVGIINENEKKKRSELGFHRLNGEELRRYIVNGFLNILDQSKVGIIARMWPQGKDQGKTIDNGHQHPHQI